MQKMLDSKSDQDLLVRYLYALMSAVFAPSARYLVQQPTGIRHTAEPTSGCYDFTSKPRQELRDLTEAVAAGHPNLADVGGRVGNL